jgi:hypothetical protein
LHFIPVGKRFGTLRHLHRRLKPGGPVVVAITAFRRNCPSGDTWLAHYAA